MTDGYLEIDPITDKVTVTVTEKSGSAVYNGQEHSVTGYETMTANNALYDVKKNVAETQTAAWTAKGTDVGEYPVGIVSGDFVNTSKNFTNVVFTVADGALTISPSPKRPSPSPRRAAAKSTTERRSRTAASAAPKVCWCPATY